MNPNFLKQPKGFATKAIHFGQDPEQWSSLAVVAPITLSVNYKQDAPGVCRGYNNSRDLNPSRHVLEKCIASLDNAKYGLTFSSGQGATTSILNTLKNGDHIICGDDVYGGTYELIVETASKLGIQVSFVDTTNLNALKAAIKENTKLLWFESPTNPTMKVTDIKAVSDICHNHGEIIVAIDNTFLTSYFQRPLELGADLVMYSMTKFMNGHTDVIMGGITMNSEELFKKLKFIQNANGIIPSPFDCYLVTRGLKTLAIRMEQHQKNSIEIARYLEAHPYIERVLHPALPSHPQHEICLKQSYGSSGVFSFYLKGNLKNSVAFLKALKVFTMAASLGGFESLAGLPKIMSHHEVPVEKLEKVGINDSLIRCSVGLEDVRDLIADLEAALLAAQKA